MPSSRARLAIVLIALTLAAAVLRLWALPFGLPQPLARPDEEAIASAVARIVRYGPNPQFFDYPTAFFYAVALVEKTAPDPGLDTSRAITTARRISASCGILCVPLLFVAARRLCSERVAVIGAALLAVAFLHVRDSHFGVTDVPMTFMVLLAFAAIVSLPRDHPRWPPVAAAAFLCGLAASTKYNGGMIAAALVVALIVTRAPRVLYAVAGASILAGFLVGTPYAWIAREQFVAALTGVQHHLASGHAVDEGPGWMRHARVSLWYGVGPACLAAAVAGSLWLIAHDRRRAAVALAFPILYFAVMGSGRTAFVRHMTPMIPFVTLLAAIAIDAAASGLTRRRSHRVAMATAVVLTAAVGYSSTIRAVALNRLLSERDSRIIAAEFVKNRFEPKGASVFQTGDVYGHVWLSPEGLYPELPLAKMPTLVIVQRSRLAAYSQQPAGLAEQLRASYQLVLQVDVERQDAVVEPVFDQQDAFFVPLDGFERMLRPGPAIEVYERAR